MAVVLGILKVIAAMITVGIGLISLIRPRVGAAFADAEVPNARSVAEIWLVFGGLYVGLGLATLNVKRIFDLVASLCAMPLFSPVMLVAAVAIKWDSPGPVLFVQERIGQNKRRFPMYKFRSMKVGSENMMKEIEHLNEAEGPIFKIRNDPRWWEATRQRCGNFIRNWCKSKKRSKL